MLTNRLIQSYQSDMRLRSHSESNIKTYSYSISLFGTYLSNQDKGFVNATKDDLKGFLMELQSRELKQGSLQMAFSALGSFYDYLLDVGQIDFNPVGPFKKRYLRFYKSNSDRDRRRCLSIDEVAMLINTTLDTRNKAIITLLAKTGMRRHELTALDLGDLNLANGTIILKPTSKRTNRTLFLDQETIRILANWLEIRSDKFEALFSSTRGRLAPFTIRTMVKDRSKMIGIGDNSLKRDYITPHYFRVWFTTMLIRSGMRREFIQALRGDAGEPIDIYHRIETEELKLEYLTHIPQLGI
jgi:site-specific recombinase XerD